MPTPDTFKSHTQELLEIKLQRLIDELEEWFILKAGTHHNEHSLRRFAALRSPTLGLGIALLVNFDPINPSVISIEASKEDYSEQVYLNCDGLNDGLPHAKITQCYKQILNLDYGIMTEDEILLELLST